MRSMGVAGTTGLIVPLDVEAYCVGAVDAHEQTVGFAGATTTYAEQTTDPLPAFLGVNVRRDYDQPPLWPMEQGVHLHWAMPDALTRADSTDLTFPALPNRWLVTRVVVSGGPLASKSWIVMSDALSTVRPDGKNAPTLPVKEPPAAASGPPGRGFRYLGAWQLFDGSWTDPTPPPGTTIVDLCGAPIHAAASGDIAFAAFYPNARDVFGFWDDLSDVDTSHGAVNLMYVVTGYYSDPADDPVAGGKDPASLSDERGWELLAAASPASYSLYSGFAQDIVWSPSTRYISQQGAPLALDVAVGNHPAEALSAYMAGKSQPQPAGFEDLLTLFQLGLLSGLAAPVPGQLAALDEELLARQFGATPAGTLHTLVAADDSAPDEAGAATPPPLPVALADALNLLNEYQAEADEMARIVTAFKWQLFADWYRLFQVARDNENEAFNAFSTRAAGWSTTQGLLTGAQDKLAAQLQAVGQMLPAGYALQQVPAQASLAPTEPVVLLAGDAVRLATRYGGDGRFHPEGKLACRTNDAVVTAVTLSKVGGGTVTLSASQVEALSPPSPNHLPYASDIAALVLEAVLLNTRIAAAASGNADAALTTALDAALKGGAPSGAYQAFTGTLPSPVAVTWWEGENPWLPFQVLWTANYHPLSPTVTSSGALSPYAPAVVTGNFALDTDDPRFMAYAPNGPGSIDVDPSKVSFDPTLPGSGTVAYTGAGVLSSKTAENLADQITKYLASHADPTLSAVLSELQATPIVMQAMTGLNSAFLMRAQALQLDIGVSSAAPMPFQVATRQTTSIITQRDDIPPLSPLFNGAFSPLRAGFMKPSLTVLDAFGQKRPVEIQNVYISRTLATTYRGEAVPGVVTLPPRLVQPSRLLFRWLAADAAEYVEMNDHPATTPICGFLLPSHLVVGVFFYNALGAPLGALSLTGDKTRVVWQATPGDDATVDQDVATVMASQNPHLRDLAVALGASTPAFFEAFWTALDAAATSTAPSTLPSQSGLALLVGRPVALCQASLRLALSETVAYNQSFSTLVDGQTFEDTDSGISGLRLPVVLGDLKRLDDGLVGYFKQGAEGAYDLSTFYTEAATSGATSGVVVPSTTSLLLSPSAPPEGAAPSPSLGAQKVLMLLDPRAAVHAVTGILPTATLSIPPDQYADTLADLNVTFQVSPVLQPAPGVSLPLPTIGGVEFAFIEEETLSSGKTWRVIADIAAPIAGAVWQYSPQALTEGWLRVNPTVLRFALTNASGAPVVQSGAGASLVLTVTNLRKVPTTFSPGKIVNEDAAKQGSSIYIHFGQLVPDDAVSSMSLAAAGWTFSALSDDVRGHYWAATPASEAVTLAPGASFTVALTNMTIASGISRAKVYFDYYGVTPDADGVDVSQLAVQSPGSSVARAVASGRG
ncbi:MULTISPECIES: hypothetical protein [Sorangium]|uniref:Uncharacterized protein n=1 Tax=Sorangium cellulosum TaxID=56 RepID=A0A4P2R435_SORCE|nr:MULTISPECIES: hypothetical protein [Sorangium]AUX37488.1 hypothetical protein SOCE836_097130 [Sorangium cellulosum]WCQ96779.1 hypothetical protein NQZ70_09566 [Sorangium sp. Soce836]